MSFLYKINVSLVKSTPDAEGYIELAPSWGVEPYEPGESLQVHPHSMKQREYLYKYVESIANTANPDIKWSSNPAPQHKYYYNGELVGDNTLLFKASKLPKDFSPLTSSILFLDLWGFGDAQNFNNNSNARPKPSL